MLAYAPEQPAHGQLRTSNELHKLATFISPNGLRMLRILIDQGTECYGRADQLDLHAIPTKPK